MDYTGRYKISNDKTVGRLLPYFARGRKIYLLLLSALKPLESIHFEWLLWAQERMISARINFQTLPMQWLLKHRLKKYFKNPEDEFVIGKIVKKNYFFAADYQPDEEGKGEDVQYIYPDDTEDIDTATMRHYREISSPVSYRFSILAPEMKDPTQARLYVREIQNIISQYSIITNYNIIIDNYFAE